MKAQNYATDPQAWGQVKGKIEMVQAIREGELKIFLDKINAAIKESSVKQKIKSKP